MGVLKQTALNLNFGAREQNNIVAAPPKTNYGRGKFEDQRVKFEGKTLTREF